MNLKIVRSILIIILLYVPALADNYTTKLPWEIIAEKFRAKELFCVVKSEDEKIDNFALDPDAMAIIVPSNIEIPPEQTEAELNLSEWQQDQWVDLPPLFMFIDPNDLKVDINTKTERFYTLTLTFNNDNISRKNIFYAIVIKDWKKDLLSWCRKNKEQIETDYDPQLIYSSIAVSHFDNLMKLISKSKMLTENILSALADAVKAKADFKAGNCPDLAIGLNKLRLKRFEGSPIVNFALHIPEQYSILDQWPVYIHITRTTGHYGQSGSWRMNIYHDGMLDMWWHTSLENLQWKDYVFLIGILKNKLNIDKDRFFLQGLCGDGIVAMSLAVNYPDQWAKCIFSTGNSYRHLAGNALNLPIAYDNVHKGNKELTAYSDFAVKCFKYYGCKNFEITNSRKVAKTQDSLSSDETRISDPNRVLYTIENLNNTRAYWVRIDGREDENITGTIDASVQGQKILIKTTNINAYYIDLLKAPVDHNKPVEIVENGESLDITTEKVFSKRPKAYTEAEYIKNSQLHGPVWDVFTDPYVVVHGNSSGDSIFNNSCKMLAKNLAKDAPCINDSNVPEDLIKSHNIVLVGTAKSNHLLSKISKKLPVQINEDLILANNESYKGDIGTFFAYPNPLNPQKYIAVFSGTSTKAVDNLFNAFSQTQKMKYVPSVDVGIFEVTQNGDIKWQIAEKFNTAWGWHEKWDEVLALTKEEHPKWQWHQLITTIIRQQINADVVILDDIFRFENSVPSGKITYRDLFNTFQNNWIVKINLNGEQLRRVATAPFNNKRKVKPPVIGGLFIAESGEHDDKTLAIGELKKDQIYTLACHYKSINGTSLNLGLDDYEIADEGYLVPLLKNFFLNNKNYNLDTELNNLKPSIF